MDIAQSYSLSHFFSKYRLTIFGFLALYLLIFSSSQVSLGASNLLSAVTATTLHFFNLAYLTPPLNQQASTSTSLISIQNVSISSIPTINLGQSEVFYTYVTGGTPPYTYNFMIYDLSTNTLLSSSVQSSSTYIFHVNGNATSAFYANVSVSDNSTPIVQSTYKVTSVVIVNSTAPATTTQTTTIPITTNTTTIPVTVNTTTTIPTTTTVPLINQTTGAYNIGAFNFTVPSYNLQNARSMIGNRRTQYINITVPYGTVPGKGAGSNLFYPTILANNTGRIYNIIITKAIPKLSISLGSGATLSKPNTTTYIYLPIFQGHVGMTNSKTYNYSFTVSADNLNPLFVTYRYAQGDSGYNFRNMIIKNFSQTISFTNVPINQTLNVSIESTGNSNYSTDDPTATVVPTNILQVLPISIHNQQSNRVIANTPIMIGVNGLGIGTANIIGFNAVQYQTYESANLMNIEFFYTNGTVIPSWMEGNWINEMTANGLATSTSSQNALINSANVIWWIKPNNGLFPGSATNVIFMGFASTTQNLMTGVSGLVGEAPQLSCDLGKGGVLKGLSTCLTYGKYDNGNIIFGANGLYMNFSGSYSSSGTPLPAGYPINVVNSPNDGALTWSIANDLGPIKGTTDGGQAFVSNRLYPMPIYSEALLTWSNSLSSDTTPIYYGPTVANTVTFLSYSATNTLENSYMLADLNTFTSVILGTNTANNVPISSSIFNPTAASSLANISYVQSIIWAAQGSEIGSAFANTITYTDSNVVYAGDNYIHLGIITTGLGEPITYYQWFRGRAPPPSDIMPDSAIGQLEAAPGVTIGNPTNAIVDVGQYESLTATDVGGTANYQYTFNSVNSITLAKANTITVTGQSGLTYTWTDYIGQSDTTNSPEKANVFVQDSNSLVSISAYSSTYAIYNSLTGGYSTPTLSFQLASPDSSGYETLSAYAYNGAPPYSYNFLVYNSITKTLLFHSVQTTNTFSFIIPPYFVGNTLNANVIITDSATVKEIVNSVLTSSITVAAQPQITVPNNVVAILPILLSNPEPFSVPFNTPIVIGSYGSGLLGNTLISTGPSQIGNVIGFNALAYTSYESANLMNTEFFYANGLVISSWLEGNLLGETSANGLATTSSSANALINSANIIFWILPGNSILPAYSSNIIYMGFGKTSNTLMFVGGSVGEAPELSCDNGAGAMLACLTYAKYDNGNTIFGNYGGFYTNFSGTNFRSGITNVIATGSNAFPENLLLLGAPVSATGNSLVYWKVPLTQNVISEAYMTSNTYTLNDYQTYLGEASTTTQLVSTGTLEKSWLVLFYPTSNIGNVEELANTATTGIPVVPAGNTVTSVVTYGLRSMLWLSNSNEIIYDNYLPVESLTNTLVANNAIFPYIGSHTSGAIGVSTYQWWRARISPPAGIMPNTYNGVIDVLPTISISAPSNVLADAGQYESFTATATAGMPNYIYTFNAVNSLTTGTITNGIYAPAVSSLTDKWTYYLNSFDPSNSPEEANVVLKDGLGITVKTGYSSTYAVNSALTNPPTLIASNLVLAQTGDYTLITPTYSGGTWPYTQNIIISNSISPYPPINTITLTSNDFATSELVYIPSWVFGNTIQVNVVVTDSASTNVVVNSVYTALSFGGQCTTILTPSNIIGFGSLSPGTQNPTSVLVTDQNTGTANANIVISGILPSGNWIGSGTNSFYVSNTAWNPTSLGSFGGNLLTTSAVDTTIVVPGSSSNSIYFGLTVPQGQPADTYNSIITITNSC